MRQKIVSVIGGRECSAEVEYLAHELGKKLVKVVSFIVCGGLSGTMKAVCQGFKAEGGITIGITPSYSKQNINPYVDIVIPTGLGFARNALVVSSGDAVVALPGGAGTLSEIGLCLQLGIPLIGLGASWKVKGLRRAASVDQAIRLIKNSLRKH